MYNRTPKGELRMKPYLKYIILFIILTLIGVLGINLYKQKPLETNPKTKKEPATESKVDHQEEKTTEETTTPSEKESTKVEETSSEKETSALSPTTNQNTPVVDSKGTTSPKLESENEKGTVSSSTNPKDLTPNFHISSMIQEKDNVIEVISDYNTSKDTISNNSNTTNNNVENFQNTQEENITIEVDSSIYKEFIPNTPQSSSSDSSNQTTTSSNSKSSPSTSNTTANPEKNTSTKKQENSFSTNIDFTKVDQCVANKTIKKIKGTNGKVAKIHPCIEDYNLNNQNRGMQNFAITNNYVYFSYLARGAWVKTEDKYQELGKIASLKQTSANYIVRVDRKTNKYQTSYVEFAGHAQSFDVTKEEEIYLNYFAKLYKGSLGYGAGYVGLTNIKFKENNKKSGVEIIPEKALYVNKNGTKFTFLHSSKYNLDNKFQYETYYQKVRAIATSENKMSNPEIAIDEDRNRIALVSYNTAYIYKLSDLKKGKATLLNKFTIETGKQGVELYNGYLYLWTGNYTHSLRKYNITNGSLVNQITFNLNNYYKENEGGESEGISIYNGNIYIGITGSKCNNKKCNDLFLVEGF